MEKTELKARMLSSRRLLSCGCLCPGQLKSNSPRLMDEAVLALRNLARQCSDSSATEAVTRHLFAILGGEQAFLAGGIAEEWVPGPAWDSGLQVSLCQGRVARRTLVVECERVK